jgi:hypothetical protein
MYPTMMPGMPFGGPKFRMKFDKRKGKELFLCLEGKKEVEENVEVKEISGAPENVPN